MNDLGELKTMLSVERTKLERDMLLAILSEEELIRVQRRFHNVGNYYMAGVITGELHKRKTNGQL